MADEPRQSSLTNNFGNARENSLAKWAATGTHSQLPRNGAGILVAGAGLLVLLGLMAQLGELGLGPFTRDSFWIIPFLAEGLWNILRALVTRTAFAAAIPFWPLAFVLAGCVTIFLLNSQGREATQESTRGSDRDR
ncbi:MAG TPA: hypothetical protein VLV89_02655 [Candidatus Acidoferrum sp.]|nr:hypothetical protein [Candidatus Acidoferrum sp.]